MFGYPFQSRAVTRAVDSRAGSPKEKMIACFLTLLLSTLLKITTSGFLPSSKPAPVLGVECGACEDVLDTFKLTYPCSDSDIGDDDGSSSSDPEDDIHCTFRCTMLCTDDEESCIKRRKMCEKGQKNIDTSTSLFKYIWQVNTCNMDVVDACARLSPSLQMSLGFLPSCTETDWNILTSRECKDNVNCEEAKGGAVDDACFTCMWLFKTTPLFAGVCEPSGVTMCDKFRMSVINTEAITKELYLDDVPDPWSMPPWGRFGKLGQVAGAASALFGQRLRRRRLLDAKHSNLLQGFAPTTQPPPFTKDDERAIGSPKLSPLKSTMSLPGNCMKLWRQMENSKSGRLFSQRMENSQSACKCLCQCPYATNEWLELEPKCKAIVNNGEYEYDVDDILGRECKDKKIDDQDKFEEEAEEAAEEGEKEVKVKKK